MKFHLDYIPHKAPFDIDHKHDLFLIGSCFSENIGKLLNDYKFKTYLNPNGILFNPLSILQCLENALKNKEVEEDLFLSRNGFYYSYLHHSSLNSKLKDELSQKIKTENKTTETYLKNCDYLIITFGTAYYYYHTALTAVVANCHKQPAATFDKRLLSVNEITNNYSRLVTELLKINPKLKIIFTVSPVKYLRDGLLENNISKSTLLLSVHEMVKTHSNCFYFPAYELVNDDLRDYRFYKEDLAHPSEQAINYVWEKFSLCYFNTKTLALNTEINSLNLALAHRQSVAGEQHDSTERHKLMAFIKKQKEKIIKLNSGIEF